MFICLFSILIFTQSDFVHNEYYVYIYLTVSYNYTYIAEYIYNWRFVGTEVIFGQTLLQFLVRVLMFLPINGGTNSLF